MQIFITGTDTNIGKTFISAIWCKKFNCEYFKPIQTGIEKDTDFVAQFNIKIHKETYHFHTPVSPNIAAKIENKTIEIEKIHLPDALNLVVEGAGGILAPINENHKIIDLIKHLNIPTIVVFEDKLGCVNHTLMTIEILRQNKVEILGVVAYRVEKNNPQDNLNNIKHHGNIDILMIIEDDFNINSL